MSLDVLLVNPNRMKPAVAPLALEYLATALETAGLSCALSDLCFADNPQAALVADLNAHDPRLIAVTWRNSDDCYCATQHSFIPDYQKLVETIRAHSDAPIVMGGAGYSTAPVALLDETGADYGIVGDGEGALVGLARANGPSGRLEVRPMREDSLTRAIAGLVWRDGTEWRVNPPAWAPFGQEALLRDHLDNARYFREGGQAGLETKRGCPMGCVYCADVHSKGQRSRLRPPSAVAREAANLLVQGIDAIHLCDSEFNLPLDHAKDVCRALIAEGLGERLRWWGYLSPAPVDDELIGLMVRAGCQGANFGADNGSAAMLQRLGRPYTPDDLIETGRLCRAHGLTFMYDLLLGGPGETRATLRETVELMKRIGPDCVGVSFGLRLYANTGVAGLIETGGRSLRGRVEDNPGLAWPVHYLEAELGADAVGYLRELIGGDRRFFFGWPDDSQADYNYDDNEALVTAIRKGARGAYWDILRKL